MRHAWISLSLLVPLGCEQSSAPAPATSAAAVESAPAPVPSADRGRRPARGDAMGMRRGGYERARGASAMLFASARELELTADKKSKLEQLQRSLFRPEPAASEPREAMQGMQAGLSDDIKAGKIDPAKLRKHSAALEKAEQAHKHREATALNGLHVLLDAAERKSLVAQLRSRQPSEPRRAGRPRLPAAAARPSRQLERWKKELELDAEQQKRVEALLVERPGPAAPQRDPEAAKKRSEALLAAFEKDVFDATRLDLGGSGQAMKPDAMAEHFNGLLAILTPAQREKLATSFQRGPAMRPGPGGVRGRGPSGFRRGGLGFPGWDEGAEEDSADGSF
jgi:hypothetical protein